VSEKQLSSSAVLEHSGQADVLRWRRAIEAGHDRAHIAALFSLTDDESANQAAGGEIPMRVLASLTLGGEVVG